MALDRKRMATNLVRLREEKRWTQAKLVEESGVSLRTVQRIEKPKLQDTTEIRYSTIEKLADALGTTAEAISDGASLAADPPIGTPDLMGAMNGGSADPPEWARRLFNDLDEKLDQILTAVTAGAADQAPATTRPSKSAERASTKKRRAA